MDSHGRFASSKDPEAQKQHESHQENDCQNRPGNLDQFLFEQSTLAEVFPPPFLAKVL